ncbi:hypothetical protein BGX20_004295 [Mortierella sp. AD010]|nr:hypothetical protein BGX20_004295 [Mortierella sp. AD010]
MMPHGGQPFVQAGYDVARLANILYAHSLEPTVMDISVRLRLYEAARQEEAQDAVKESHRFVKVLNQQGWIGTMTRYMVLNLIPKLSQYILGDRMNTELPQVDFLVKEELK